MKMLRRTIFRQIFKTFLNAINTTYSQFKLKCGKFTMRSESFLNQPEDRGEAARSSIQKLYRDCLSQ